MYHYALGILAILVSLCIVSYVRWKKTIYDPIQKIQGPKYYPFIGTLHQFIGAGRYEIYKIMLETMEQYKPFFRTWRGFNPEVHISKPEYMEIIMSSSTQIQKSSGYLFLKDWLGDGLLLSDGLKWHQRRKMITPTFHFKILENFMNVFVEKSKVMVDCLEKKSNGDPFNIYPYITRCALDIICETAMGVSVNAISDTNNRYTQAIYSVGELVLKRFFFPMQQTKLYPLLKDGKTFQKNLDILHDFTNKVIADRRLMLNEKPLITRNEGQDDLLMTKKKRLSFLDLLLDASDKLTDADIREEVDTFMFEGHDTTTVAMCWTLLLLANHPDIQQKVYEEVKDVLQNKRTPTSISELNEMRYLECCIKEALRLYPSVPLIGRTLKEDIVLDGKRIPKGTDCYLHIFLAHRCPEIYPEPEKFDPDRFLPINTANRHPFAYVPFSAGPRNCIGQKFAMYEEKTVLASILRSYKLLPVDTMESVGFLFELILRPTRGLNIALCKRYD